MTYAEALYNVATMVKQKGEEGKREFLEEKFKPVGEAKKNSDTGIGTKNRNFWKRGLK